MTIHLQAEYPVQVSGNQAQCIGTTQMSCSSITGHMQCQLHVRACVCVRLGASVPMIGWLLV